mmetsp:Transcript_2085/g.5505  ORF Transcript_2085/g.5505 Transcript_2085/m.5505 type:complete len:81 (-) Transcript_2085:616-858(-)
MIGFSFVGPIKAERVVSPKAAIAHSSKNAVDKNYDSTSNIPENREWNQENTKYASKCPMRAGIFIRFEVQLKWRKCDLVE